MTTVATPPPDDPAWAGIRARYEKGEEKVKDIAAGIGLPGIGLSSLAKRLGWLMRGLPRVKRTAAPKAKAKPETTRATILRLKEMLQTRVKQVEAELKDIGTELDAVKNERGIKNIGILVRTIEKVLDLERNDTLKRRKAIREFKYFDDEQRRQLAAKIDRLEAERDRDLVVAGPDAGGGGGSEQPVALLGEAGPATAADD
ncbi:MAG: hypothetical protein LCH46_09515 [Proteobacteria bacterium]|nr:hypothetical protein [Pseudomonadota bacterium]